MRSRSRTTKRSSSRAPPVGGGAAAAAEEEGDAYFLDGTYLDDAADDKDGDGHLDTHGCLPRFRVWTAGLLHPRRYLARVPSWTGVDEHRYNPLY